MSEINLTKSELVKELKRGSIAGVAGNELVVKFVFKNGFDNGYMIDSHSAIKRFQREEKAWAAIEQIKKRQCRYRYGLAIK